MTAPPRAPGPGSGGPGSGGWGSGGPGSSDPGSGGPGSGGWGSGGWGSGGPGSGGWGPGGPGSGSGSGEPEWSPSPDSLPPYVPIRHTGWVKFRTPWKLYLLLAALVAGGVLIALVQHPSKAQRASDVRAFLHDMSNDIASCAAGVKNSLYALHAIQSGSSNDVALAVKIATQGAGTCSPADNVQLAALTQYQVTESLYSFRLDRAANGLVTWAFPDAQNVQLAVAKILTAHGQAAKTKATARLHAALARLDAQRIKVNKVMEAAIKATGARASPPHLPG